MDVNHRNAVALNAADKVLADRVNGLQSKIELLEKSLQGALLKVGLLESQVQILLTMGISRGATAR